MLIDIVDDEIKCGQPLLTIEYLIPYSFLCIAWLLWQDDKGLQAIEFRLPLAGKVPNII